MLHLIRSMGSHISLSLSLLGAGDPVLNEPNYQRPNASLPTLHAEKGPSTSHSMIYRGFQVQTGIGRRMDISFYSGRSNPLAGLMMCSKRRQPAPAAVAISIQPSQWWPSRPLSRPLPWDGLVRRQWAKGANGV